MTPPKNTNMLLLGLSIDRSVTICRPASMEFTFFKMAPNTKVIGETMRNAEMAFMRLLTAKMYTRGSGLAVCAVGLADRSMQMGMFMKDSLRKGIFRAMEQ